MFILDNRRRAAIIKLDKNKIKINGGRVTAKFSVPLGKSGVAPMRSLNSARPYHRLLMLRAASAA